MKNKNKNAFTLAEVLITLGIIGVIAAMTLPNLIDNIQRKDYTAKLKKFNANMGQALVSAENEFGPISDWDFNLPINKFVETYLGQFLKFQIMNKYSNNATSALLFPDGTTMELHKGSCMDLIFDVNGTKKPNKYGYDQFGFLACPLAHSSWYCGEEKNFCTYGYNYQRNSRETSIETCKNHPDTCATLLQIDNWEFKKDYPFK